MEQEQMEIIRHGCAHAVAAAAQELFPGAKFGVGPIVENGFYYDISFPQTIGEEDLERIEKKAKEIIKKGIPYETEEMKIEEAIDYFAKKGQVFKVDLLNDLKEKGTTKLSEDEKQDIGDMSDTVSIYKTGEFVDLCKGPHIATTKEINPDGLKLIKLAGAYWRGDEKNAQLQRIYGVCFETKEILDGYLELLEEIKRRDHRKIGKELELYTISPDIGPGLIIWLPHGNIVKEELENWAKETESKWGYQRVTTPLITKEGLFYTSEHLPHYSDSMFAPMEVDNEKYYIKPMNCPFHHKIFSFRKRSYRELPLRLAEYGVCHRYEDSGSVMGLMRVRGMQMNDAHIYCTKEQAIKEFIDVIKLHQYYYDILGIKEYFMELALRDPESNKYHGDDEMWEEAEKMMREAMDKSGVPYVVENDGAAFYGPKIDFQIKSVTGRSFTASTNQIDLFMPKKFDLKYTDKDGSEKYAVCIHRAPLGTHERFIGFLIEHYAGAFPVWLSPVHVQLVPVSEKHIDGARELAKEMDDKYQLRVEVEQADETVGNKVRKAVGQKIPYIVVVGDRELDGGEWTIRVRGQEEQLKMSKDEFIEKIKQEINNKVNN